MKVMTVLGTRPEIIRLSQIIPKLDALCDHVLVHTGQNHHPALSDQFFEDFLPLTWPRPELFLPPNGAAGIP